MDETEIKKYLKSKASPKHIFIGVVASDELPRVDLKKVLTSPADAMFLVVNTGTRQSGGSHWIAIYFDLKRKTIEHYDPLGNPPEGLILRWMKELERQNAKLKIKEKFQFKVNRVIVQGIYYKEKGKTKPDIACGIYAMSFIQRRMGGETFKDASGFSSHGAKVKHLKSFGYRLNFD